MLHSMTGFAREAAESAIGTLTWEIRAVNHRYLDVQFKLPEDLRPKEQVFRQQASSSLGRGKVECALYFRRAFDQDSEMQINTDLVELVGRRISDLTAKLPNVAAVNPIEILRWPGVVFTCPSTTQNSSSNPSLPRQGVCSTRRWLRWVKCGRAKERASRPCSKRVAPKSKRSRSR